jgi:hypothetical protein
MKLRTMTRSMKAIGALGLGMVLMSGQPAAARERIRQDLTAVADQNASGQVRLRLSTASVGRFELRARALDPNASYEVLVGGVKVGTLTTTGGGAGRVRFSTRPRGRDLLLGFDPRGTSVVLRNAAGEDVLGGTVPAGTTSGSPDKVVCCVPDDSNSECEGRTAAECTAQGGTVSTATSCLPNPCGNTPPVGGDVVCCIPDDSGPECEDRTATECSAQGGVVVQATSCDPNPCAATPATTPDIRCCLPDDSGVECEDRTAAQCTAQGGVDMGPGSCVPNPCANGGTQGGGDDNGGHHGGGRATGATSPVGDNHGGRPTYY